MNLAKRTALALLIIASSAYLITSKPEPPVPDEDARPIDALAANTTAVNAIKTEALRRQHDRNYKALQRQAVIYAQEAHAQGALRIAEAKHKADVKAAQARVAQSRVAQASRTAPPSRSQAYVGQAQSYEATFYTAFCPTGCTGVTASGYDVSSTIHYEGMRILAAPESVPLYSILRITLADGSTFDGIVLDRGGDIGAGRIDILVKTRQEAYVLGRQAVEVRLVRRGK
ncbi:3D domain-containing protein [Sporosarcina sp. E16_3]|uniref:3D domain-containing protein n=1 Tax=Sporosarcina sp. E16_3 TaxID=2789293 RepID=UPI001A9117EB|nr:3D domain-containing protein [Sporosarcina sp. E16_3]MBO0602722.1 3D domain-containing protein [Sporosarcina sp. E16_3]